MRNIRHITLALALCLLMVLAIPMTAQAAEIPAIAALPDFSFTAAAPDTITVTAESGEMPVLNAPNYLTEAQAVEQLRTYMIQRRETCTVYVKSESYDYQAVGSSLLEQAFAHTGNPKGGDYLALHCLDGGAQVTEDSDGTYYLYTFDFEFVYSTTATQESALDNAVATLLNSLNVRNKSEYEKVSAVYNYIRNNITFDEVHAPDETYLLKHTAYAALVNKTAVTDGMSTLLYRLLLELGVDNRIILGETSGGVHCWNIIKLDSVYYNTDIAYDTVQSDYSFFLRNSENFPDHYRYMEYDSVRFHTDYPISATDYVPGVVGEPEYVYVWGICGDDAYWVIDRDKNLTIFGTGMTWDYDSYTDPLENGHLRYWEDGIQNVIIEDGITELGQSLFSEMEAIRSVQFPSTLIAIRDNTFQNCKGITSVLLPDSIYEIGYASFSGCENLRTLYLGSGLKTIGDRAFSGCKSLTTLQLPEGLESIGTQAFYGIPIREITIPASLRVADGFGDNETLETINLYSSAVGAYAFYNCRNLRTVNFYGDLEKIDSAAFQDCTSLTELTLPETVTSIGPSAFSGCSNLKKITINGGGIISSYAFAGCSSLTTVELLGPVTQIWMCAFDYCTALTEITFPATVTSIDGFRGCTALRTITFEGDSPSIDMSAFEGVTATAYYPGENPTWTASKLQDYGGNLTWVSMHTHQLADSDPVFDAATRTHKQDCLTCDVGLVQDCSFTSAVTQEAGLNTSGIRKHTCTVCGGSYEETFHLRIFGANRYETSFSAADMLKAELGVDKFGTIIVASGLDFADALTGSYLAAAKSAPILLVNQHFMDEAAAYINENLAPGGRVYLLGGELAVLPAMEEMLSGLDVKRLAGANRLETNLLILNEAGVGDEEILVCYSHGFADSLSASAVGKPILMVNNRQLTQSQKDFLAGANREFVIIGGESAVSADMAAQLEAYGTTERIGGSNRYETSINVAKRFFDAPEAVVLAYGANFPDGLCGGPLAYSVGAPLILTRDVNARLAADYTAEYGITNGSVLGGTGLISDEAVNTILSQ